MQSVLIFFLAQFLPLLLVATALYVAFSVAVCSAAAVFPGVESYFVSKISKTVPLFAISAILVTLRWY
ncbi:MAG: hypothetical protein HY795_10070 [Desulfovibrio sp.]|nr:hypothetical protein [Desulfovibrio sp.]MBI4959648.1 hypothetical protein [Desulfovibrio sp.]